MCSSLQKVAFTEINAKNFKSQKKNERENFIKEREKEDFTLIMSKTP